MNFTSPTTAEALVPMEIEFIGEFLADYAEEVADQNGNDYEKRGTPENRAVFTVVYNHQRERDPYSVSNYDPEIMIGNRRKIRMWNEWVARYFAFRCTTLFKSPSGAALTPAELNIIGDLMCLASGEHEQYSDTVCYDLTFPATTENKAFFLSVVETFKRKIRSYDDGEFKDAANEKAAASLDVIHHSTDPDDDIDLPDFWIMYYLAVRCKKQLGGQIHFLALD